MSPAPPRTAAQQAARRWSWWALWLWLAVPFLLVLTAVVTLPMAFEQAPADRADAVAILRLPVAVLLAASALAAAAGRRAARRARHAPRRGVAETAGSLPR